MDHLYQNKFHFHYASTWLKTGNHSHINTCPVVFHGWNDSMDSSLLFSLTLHFQHMFGLFSAECYLDCFNWLGSEIEFNNINLLYGQTLVNNYLFSCCTTSTTSWWALRPSSSMWARRTWTWPSPSPVFNLRSCQRKEWRHSRSFLPSGIISIW